MVSSVLDARFYINPNEIKNKDCLKRIMNALHFGEYANQSKLEKKVNNEDGAREDDMDALAILAHLAVRFSTDKNSLGADFSVLTGLISRRANAGVRQIFTPLVTRSLTVIEARFRGFVAEYSLDKEDAALNVCSLVLSYAFVNNLELSILKSGCVSSIAAYFSSKIFSSNIPGASAARRTICLGISA